MVGSNKTKPGSKGGTLDPAKRKVTQKILIN